MVVFQRTTGESIAINPAHVRSVDPYSNDTVRLTYGNGEAIEVRGWFEEVTQRLQGRDLSDS